MLQHFGYARQTPSVEPCPPPPVPIGRRRKRHPRFTRGSHIPRQTSTGFESKGEDMEKIRIEQHTFAGGLWFAGWLFTLGVLHLSFWKGFLALVVWPYYLGVAASTYLPH